MIRKCIIILVALAATSINAIQKKPTPMGGILYNYTHKPVKVFYPSQNMTITIQPRTEEKDFLHFFPKIKLLYIEYYANNAWHKDQITHEMNNPIIITDTGMQILSKPRPAAVNRLPVREFE